jgi:DNA mismatch repair protein MutL
VSSTALTRPRIQPLPTLVANQIAAGEVVERPASVVKELVENSLDAGATRIQLDIESGGIELVRVTDDGSGIPPDDLPLAIAPHATSKIASVEDLDQIATLGFRGEALASIASVSRTTIRSRTPASDGAFELDVEGATVKPIRPASGNIGTVITVRNLFFNTPARRKFLKTVNTERERCFETFQALVLAHPNVAFTMTVDGKREKMSNAKRGGSPRPLLIRLSVHLRTLCLSLSSLSLSFLCLCPLDGLHSSSFVLARPTLVASLCVVASPTAPSS